jgi:hypothetical protein
MTDTLLTLLIVGGCAVFICIRTIKSFLGKGNSCGCSCSGGCSTSSPSACDKPGAKTPLQQMPEQSKQQGENK